MAKSSIEWTEETWNPTTGCDKVSTGCKFCYAEVMSKRLKAMGLEKYKYGFQVRMHQEELTRPYRWKKSKMVFVNSMSDLFHEDIPLDFIKQVFKVMNENPKHTFQVLTKRAERLESLSPLLNWTPNIWMGVSVENQKVSYRINHLQKTHAFVKFLSLEPLIGPLTDLDLIDMNWVIVGGESGKGKIRPLQKEWIIDLKNQCQSAKVPFFFKQWGGSNKKKAGRLLNGKEYNEMPSVAVNDTQPVVEI
ncbi:MAG: phage Gp37/Gp68 family protein [Bernardetiaceae bacterium]|nr:phage Gp37/Gp68 family protein [Bernardetiaceae bacterium]